MVPADNKAAMGTVINQAEMIFLKYKNINIKIVKKSKFIPK